MINEKFRQRFRINGSAFIGGGVLENNKCVWTTPDIFYMKGWSKRKIVQYCAIKDLGLELS